MTRLLTGTGWAANVHLRADHVVDGCQGDGGHQPVAFGIGMQTVVGKIGLHRSVLVGEMALAAEIPDPSATAAA